MSREESIHFQSMAKVAVEIVKNKLDVEDVLKITKELVKHVPKGGFSNSGGGFNKFEKREAVAYTPESKLQSGKNKGKMLKDLDKDMLEFLATKGANKAMGAVAAQLLKGEVKQEVIDDSDSDSIF